MSEDTAEGPCEDVTLPCEDGQRYIDPSDCRSYYVCASRHRLVRLTCPLGTAWHHRARVCVDDRNVYNNGICDKTHPSSRCPRDGNATRKNLPSIRTTQRPKPVYSASEPAVSSDAVSLGITQPATRSVSGEKSGIYSKSKVTTIAPREMDATPGGTLGKSDAEVIVIAVVGGLIFAALIAIILVLIWRKRRDEKTSTQSPPPPRNAEQKPQQLSIENPEYSRRNSVIYAEIDDTMRGPLMTSTVSRDRGKTMCARLERHLPPMCSLPQPMTPQLSTISTSTSGVTSPGDFYSDPVLDSERDANTTYYEKLSSNNSDSNVHPVSNEGYDYIENGTGHVYSTLRTKVKDARYELLNEMSSASANPSESQGNSGSSSPAFSSSRPTPSVPSEYFVLDNGNSDSQRALDVNSDKS
ncbi:uncharacterized protein LOC135471791 [Liolophura sinensis]|uniref:uncharacterized protein LOC135471791 n=1 Tax=Liolophura sinensis TaxID=3198878 RepID=UPI003159045D